MLGDVKGWNLNWQALPQFPVQGVAGPFVGLLNDRLIVACGDEVFLVSGEIKPRVRSRSAWRIKTAPGPLPIEGEPNEDTSGFMPQKQAMPNPVEREAICK